IPFESGSFEWVPPGAHHPATSAGPPFRIARYPDRRTPFDSLLDLDITDTSPYQRKILSSAKDPHRDPYRYRRSTRFFPYPSRTFQTTEARTTRNKFDTAQEPQCQTTLTGDERGTHDRREAGRLFVKGTG